MNLSQEIELPKKVKLLHDSRSLLEEQSINCIIRHILSYISFKTDCVKHFPNQNADLPPIEAVHATLVRHLVRSPRICNCPGRSAGRYTFSDKLHLQEKWLRKNASHLVTLVAY